jgi:serine/threonine protein kinase
MKPPAIDRQTFLENLRRSGLLSTRELQNVIQRLPQTERGRTVARVLVEGGILTRFQADLLLAGHTGGFVLGQYQILDQIGQGGMGRVYKARHRTMNRVVALKVLANELVKTDKARRLFKHEVRAAAQLVHPNIVTAYDANKVGGRYFLVMEYVDGPNLDQLVRRRGPLPVSLACEIGRQAALGLQYAFEMGMVHRDIKPANLLVQRGGLATVVTVKILDFGLARLHEAEDAALAGAGTIQTPPHTVMGTPDYLSPEQSRDMHATDIRSDLYSLGCTLYYILTGKVPFPGGSSVDKLIRHGKEEAIPVEEHRPEVPAPVAQIIHRLMAKNPYDRFQTPAELAEALALFAKAGPASGLGLQRVPPPAREEPEADSSAVELGPVPPVSEPVAGSESTWPADLAPTPLSADVLASVRLASEAEAARRRARLFLALAGAAAILAGGLAVFFALH